MVLAAESVAGPLAADLEAGFSSSLGVESAWSGSGNSTASGLVLIVRLCFLFQIPRPALGLFALQLRCLTMLLIVTSL